MDRLRLVILGGSGAATPELGEALAAWPDGLDRRPPIELVLVGRSRAKLELVAAETRRRVSAGASGRTAPSVSVVTAVDRRAGLAGADVVVSAVRVGGLAARLFDETFPQAFGLPGEETMGPGGFANALRTVPALRAAWSDIADIAPDALLINLTNPSGIVVAAAWREARLRLVSMCDSPVTLCRSVADRLDRPDAATVSRYLGMNHVGWWVPEDENDLPKVADLATGLDPDDVAADGALGGPYVRYYTHPDRLLAAQAGAEPRASQLERLESDLLTGYAAGTADLPRRGGAWYPSAVIPLVDAWLHGAADPLTMGLLNDGRVPALPDGVLIEAPVGVPRPGTLAARLPPVIPARPMTLLARHAAYEAATVEAIATGSRHDALIEALALNPVVSSVDQAAVLADAILGGSPR